MNSNDHFFLAYFFDSMRSALLGSAKSRFLLDEDGCSLRLSIHYLTRIAKLGPSTKMMLYGINETCPFNLQEILPGK